MMMTSIVTHWISDFAFASNAPCSLPRERALGPRGWELAVTARTVAAMAAASSRAAAAVRLFLLRCIHSVYLMHLAFAEALRTLQMNLWLRRSALSATIPRVPAHLGLALGDEPIDMRRLADLVGWCAELGIHRITLCDAHGTLLQVSPSPSLSCCRRSRCAP